MKPLCFALSLFTLTACSSDPIALHYYSLHMPALATSHSSESPVPLLKVGNVRVAEYLQQPNLVMKVDQHQLYYSPQDIWAESLNAAFKKTLQQALNQKQAEQPATVHLTLDHFYLSDQSLAVATGTYWFAGQSPASAKSFAITRPLSADGYHHGVTKLVECIQQLASEIATASKG